MSLIILPCRHPSSWNWHDPLKMGWSVGCFLAMVGQLVGWSVGKFLLWLVSWYFLALVGQLVGWSVGGWSVGRLVSSPCTASFMV